MLTTKIKNETKELSLYELLQLVGQEGCDICDKIYDWGTYIGFPASFEKCQDYYDRCMLLFALNIKAIKYNPDGYTCCCVTEFMWENKEPFERFFNEENGIDYRPIHYLRQGETIDPEEDGLFYDIYLESMESLIIGNYCESDYRKLYKYLTEWNYWKNIKRLNKTTKQWYLTQMVDDVEIQKNEGKERLILRADMVDDANCVLSKEALEKMYDVKLKKEDYIVIRLDLPSFDFIGAWVTNDEGREIKVGELTETNMLYYGILTCPLVAVAFGAEDNKYHKAYIENLQNLKIYLNKEDC